MVRNDLGRFPIWPLQHPVALGDLMIFHSRHGRYSLHGNLRDFGIFVTPSGAQTVMDEYYETDNHVQVRIGPTSGSGHMSAMFRFSKNSGLVTQCFEQSYSRLPLDALARAINEQFNPAQDDWNSDWMIVTELWDAKGFTTLLSGAGGAETCIQTGIPVMPEAFNIADPSLQLGISRKSNMNYIAIAEAGINPFFRTHKLTRRNNVFKLRSYGKG